VLAVPGIEELHRNPDALGRAADAPLDHVTRVQLFAHLAHIDRSALVLERRIASDDPERLEARQLGDEVLREAVDEELLLGRTR
jgi:hypothetical protein